MIHKLRVRIKALVPLSVRRGLVKVRHWVRSLTWKSRMLPDFVIIGCQRGGTSSLYSYLGQHPQIAPSLRKETEYFTIKYDLGERWYRSHFPLRLRRRVMELLGSKLVTFEATPDYLLDPRAPSRCVELLPDTKIIVLLREPGERAVSHFHHMTRLEMETEALETAIALEDARLATDLELIETGTMAPLRSFRRHSYLLRGHYADQLEGWFDRYPRDRFLILESEKFFNDPASVLRQVLEFIDVKPWEPAEFRNYSYLSANSGQHQAVPAGLRSKMDDHFAESNRRLGDLIDEDFTWLHRRS